MGRLGKVAWCVASLHDCHPGESRDPDLSCHSKALRCWVPAFAGMTEGLGVAEATRRPMPELSLTELKAALPRGGRLLGLDLGSKTIGLAVSDGALMVASPIETIQRTKFTADATKLLAIVDGRHRLARQGRRR